MKSVPWAKLGNYNLRGKKTQPIMAGKYVEDVIVNYKEHERKKEAVKQIRRYENGID